MADHLAVIVHGPTIDADRARKRMANVAEATPLHDPAFAGRYDADTTAAVYAELLRRAAVVLDSGRSVVLDASFRDRRHRASAFELARRFGVPFLFIKCRVDPAVCRRRLEQRATGPSVSDGRLEVLDAFIASFQPVDELPERNHLRLDTDQPLEEIVSQIRQRLSDTLLIS